MVGVIVDVPAAVGLRDVGRLVVAFPFVVGAGDWFAGLGVTGPQAAGQLGISGGGPGTAQLGGRGRRAGIRGARIGRARVLGGARILRSTRVRGDHFRGAGFGWYREATDSGTHPGHHNGDGDGQQFAFQRVHPTLQSLTFLRGFFRV